MPVPPSLSQLSMSAIDFADSLNTIGQLQRLLIEYSRRFNRMLSHHFPNPDGPNAGDYGDALAQQVNVITYIHDRIAQLNNGAGGS